MDKNKSQFSNRIIQISFFKGIAILMILLCHASQKFNTPTVFHPIPSFCQMGCQIFFAISAFSLCMSMDRRNNSLKDFYKRRFFSIAPGYWFSIGVYVGFAIITDYIGGGNFLNINTDVENIVANVSLVHGLIPTEANNKVVKGGWYVGTLVLLYLLFPTLRSLYNKITQRVNGRVFIILIQIISFSLLAIINKIYPILSLNNNKFLYFSFVNQLPSFCIGILLYDLYKNNKIYCVNYPLVKSLLIGLVAFLLFFSHRYYAYVFEPAVFTVAFAYLFIYSLKKDIVSNKLCRIITSYGDISYAIYLIHPLFLYTATYLLNTYYQTGLLVYILWLPISFVLVYSLSVLYNKIIIKFQSLFRKI